MPSEPSSAFSIKLPAKHKAGARWGHRAVRRERGSRAEFGRGNKGLVCHRLRKATLRHSASFSPLSSHPTASPTPTPSAFQFCPPSSSLVFPTHPCTTFPCSPCPSLPLQRGPPQPSSLPSSPGPRTPSGRLTLMPCSTRTCSRSSSPKETFLPPWLLSLPPMPAGRALGTPLPAAPPTRTGPPPPLRRAPLLFRRLANIPAPHWRPAPGRPIARRGTGGEPRCSLGVVVRRRRLRGLRCPGRGRPERARRELVSRGGYRFVLTPPHTRGGTKASPGSLGFLLPSCAKGCARPPHLRFERRMKPPRKRQNYLRKKTKPHVTTQKISQDGTKLIS